MKREVGREGVCVYDGSTMCVYCIYTTVVSTLSANIDDTCDLCPAAMYRG